MKPYGGKTPLSHIACCAIHSRDVDMANKRAERRRAANDAARAEGHVDDFDNWCICHMCTWPDLSDSRDFEEDAAFNATPLTAPLVALALEAA